MSRHVLSRRQLVPGSLQEVFAFFENPRNLEEITPTWLRFSVLEATDDVVREGTEIRYRLHWNGLPMGWRSRITEYAQDAHFADEMLSGPYKRWYHTHRFRAVAEGVEMEDTVEYELPLGPLGDLVHALVVRRQLEAIFDYRATSIRRIFGGVTEREGPRPNDRDPSPSGAAG